MKRARGWGCWGRERRGQVNNKSWDGRLTEERLGKRGLLVGRGADGDGDAHSATDVKEEGLPGLPGGQVWREVQ